MSETSDQKTTGTIPEIHQVYGGAAGRIGVELYDRYDAIAKEKLDENTPLFDRLTDEQRRGATRDHRLKLAEEAYAEKTKQYEKAVPEYHEKLKQRKAEAEAELFGGEHSAEVLARLATAGEEEVLAAARVAAKTNNPQLRRAVLAVASERGLGESLVEVLSDRERDLLRELEDVPPQEVLDRPANAELVLPRPDASRLMPPANGTT